MLWKILVKYTKPYRWHLLAVAAFQLVQTIASLFLPSLNAHIIDNGIATGDTGYIFRTGAIMLGVTVIQIVAAVAAVFFAAQLAMRVGRDMRRDVFVSVNDFSEQEVQKFGAPSLITRSTNDVQQIQMLVLMSCTLLVTAPIAAIGGVIMALREDIVLSWILVVAIPLMLVVVAMIVIKMVPLFRLMQRRIDQVNGVLREQLMGIRVIRAFVRERTEITRFDAVNTSLMSTALGAGRLFALMFPTVTFLINISSVAVLWFGAFRIDSGDMQVGALTAYLAYLTQILMALMMTSMMAVMIPRATVSASRVGEVLDTTTSVPPVLNPVTTVETPGTLEFDSVTFHYPGAQAPVLHDISFSVAAGTTTAIIGATGSGKTTIVNLATRLFDPTAGSVRVGGVDIRHLEESLLYRQLSLVPQKQYLFSGTVASTLRYGNPDASDAEIEHAVAIAQADFVHTMPGGLAAPIAQSGSNVSGGQRQRLSIARALLANSSILIFDDSFSALDTATDRRVRQALDSNLHGVTKLIVAQRIATIVDADQILVIEEGRISARGTHKELVHTSPAYAEIAESQLSLKDAS